MDLKYLKNIVIYIISAAVSLFVIIYIIIQLFSGFGVKIDSTAAVYVTEREFITLDAYIIRSERVLYSQTKGSVNYNYENGSKVSKGTVVASVYSGGDIRKEIAEIERLMLENSNLAGIPSRRYCNEEAR